jgi:4-amino-4-deoxy-L-arabinose transferase-like glycosyltransferase
VETNSSASSQPASIESLAARTGWALLILATLYVCYFSHLGAIGFVGPDEPRYAWIARDMVETGDWVTPRLYGKPWFEKPPLYYWGTALSFRLFGVSEAAARLPSAVSALLATLALAWLALRLYGVETARWLLLLLPTTVGMIGFSRAAATDMPFSAMLTIAMVAAVVVLGLTPSRNPVEADRTGGASPAPTLSATPWLALIAFGFFLGFAVLAKGPAAIVLCGGAVFFWALFTKRWRDAFRLVHPTAIASFCATALPWYILCARRNPDFLRIFIIEHNFKRYLTPEFQHIQPFWFYVPILLLAVFPWTLMFYGPLKDLWVWRSARSPVDPACLYLCCWAGFTVLFFSVSKSKLPGYVLPAEPALALLLARSSSARFRKSTADGRPGPARTTILSVCTVLLVLVFGVGYAKAPLDQSVSARWAVEFVSRESRGKWSDTTATYKLRRAFQYSVNFYAHKEVPEWPVNSNDYEWVFTAPSTMIELQGKGLECPRLPAAPVVIVCERQELVSRPAGSGKPR